MYAFTSRTIRIVIFLTVGNLLGVGLCRAELKQTILSREQERAVLAALKGEWIYNIGGAKIRLRLAGDGGFNLNGKQGRYLVRGTTLTLKSDGGEAVYEFELRGSELTLSGGDLGQPLKFTKLPGVGESGNWLLEFSVKSLRVKLSKILIIGIVVIVCRVLLLAFRASMHFVIYSDWGPLRFVYRFNKNRIMTIYSLVINIAKYVVYLLALGFALSELGVNYTAYLASLSVIGLAIGFGSQGLVQDMVTGFFVIFEEQYNVGDMVEIPPHVGIVEELGLRMTRLRNYLGQRVVIPNRNIAAIGNFIKGAQEVEVHVAIAGEELAGEARSLLKQVSNEVARQFSGIVVAPPKLLEAAALSTGEHFVRLYLAIWPQQQWVIEQQLLPRIREAFSRKAIEIPNDRVIAFYHPREEIAGGRKRPKATSA